MRRVTAAYVAVAGGDGSGAELAEAASTLAREQGATRWRRVAELLKAFTETSHLFNAAVRSVGEGSPWNLTFVADLRSRRS